MSDQNKIIEALSKAASEAGGQLSPAQLTAMATAVSKLNHVSESSGETIAALPNVVKLGELFDALAVLKSLAEQTMDGVTARKIVLLHRWATPFAQRYERARASIAERFGTKIDGNKVEIVREKQPEYFKAMEPLRNELVVLDSELRLAVSLLTPLKMSPVQMDALSPFLDEPDPPKPDT